MKILQRAYNDTKHDFQTLWNFLIEYYKDQDRDTQWTLGRLSDWKYGLWHERKLDPSFLSNNCRLFTNFFDHVVGFAIAEEGDRMFHLLCNKNLERYLLPRMLAYVEENWCKEDGLCTEISERDQYLDTLLVQKGFEKRLSSQTTIYNLSEFEKTLSIPDGYRFVNLEDNQNYDSKVQLYLSGFQGQDEPMIQQWDRVIYSYNRKSPIYNPRYDFSLINHEGTHSSGCVCFIDFENKYAEIEKVCTHQDHRRKGLASALIQCAMMELKTIGIARAEITGYSDEAKKTYEKAEPVNIIKNYFYEKNAT